MIEIDHYAITVKKLDEAICFYQKLGYKLDKVYNDNDYSWAVLKGKIDIELFEIPSSQKQINHIGYSFDEYSDISQYVEGQTPFYGDTNRESYFIDDGNGNCIQFIKKLIKE